MVTELIKDTEYFACLTRCISSATTSIKFTFYNAHLHTERKKCSIRFIADLLVRKMQGGCLVRCIFTNSHFSNTINNNNYNFVNYMRAGGIIPACPACRNTVHSKAFIFDDSSCIVGSHNLTNQSLTRTFETSIFTNDNRVVRRLADGFETLYGKSTQIW